MNKREKINLELFRLLLNLKTIYILYKALLI